MTKQTYAIQWMSCASCANHIEKSLKKTEGIESCEVNYATEQATVTFDDTKTNINNMNQVIEPMGYKLKDHNAMIQHTMPDGTMMSADEHAAHLGMNQTKVEKLEEISTMKKNVNILIPFIVLSFVYMIADIGWKSFWVFPVMPERLYELWHHLFPIMATYVLFVIGKQYIIALRRFIKTGIAGMDTLIGLGTLTAFLYSFSVGAFEGILAPYLDVSIHYYDVVIVVIGFIYYGKYLETISKLKTWEAIEKLMDLQAKTALIEKDGVEIEVSLDQVMQGDIVIIKPWTKISVDWMITQGESSVDESMITWESMPSEKKIWDKVVGWTMNQQGFLKVKATSLGADSVLSHIITMVQQAQGSKAPIQKLADQISAVFVPIVLVIAFVSLIVWIIVGNMVFGIVAFVSVLVIACPCALWLATPTAIIVWVGKWAEHGILIKNAESLQKVLKVTTVVFDKTGTITKGKPELVDYSGENKTNDLAILASLESKSEHPIALAIVNAANSAWIPMQTVSWFETIPGKWLTGIIEGKQWYAGNAALIKDLWLENNALTESSISSQGKTPIFLMDEKKVHAVFGIADTIKDNAKQALEELHKLGIKSVMLTWDHKDTAHYIASLVWIDTVYAEVLPDQKEKIIKELQATWEIVAMCGDGVNDAPALARSDIGIAMSTGADVAIETADITLLAGDISKVVQSIKLSKDTMSAIKQNLFFAFFYNVVGIPIATGMFYTRWIVLNPLFAGLAMALSSVSVVGNSLRLKNTKL